MKWYKVVISILVIYLISLFSFSGCNGKPDIVEKTVIVTDTLYKTVTDTVTVERLLPVKEEVIKFIEVKKDTILPVFNKYYKDTLILCQNDSIIQEIYTSGLEHSIDSVKVELKKQETIITNTITIDRIIKEKPKKLSVGLNVGYGYGIFNKRPDMYAGIGICWRF